MPDSDPPLFDTTRGARSLRIAAVVAFLLVAASVPVSLLVYPGFRSKAAPKCPIPSLGGLWHGTFMTALDDHVRERSRVVDELRGNYNELLYRCGLFESRSVFLGRDGWMCFAHTRHVDPERQRANTPARLAAYRRIKQRADRLGVRVLALPVPDKVRIHPEKFFPDGREPPELSRRYDLILTELRSCGFEVVDVRALLLEERRREPGKRLFYHRDSHWAPAGLHAAAKAIARRFAELEWPIGDAVPVWVAPPSPIHLVPDLVSSLGFRNAERAKHEPISGLVAGLRETKFYFGVERIVDGARLPCPPIQPAARLAVCGTSFSDHGLHWAIMWETHRLVDYHGIRSAGGPWAGLEDLFDRIEHGTSRVQTVVWEFVERFYSESWFLDLDLR
ncbi:MAG: hypothetical protein KDC87_04005 [Planctomycetes bacterium]|nr:hypothetical protein [Planctomycetota bacterium]MCB9872093.1 hypothetical protein [Planctomycetota bacterium]